MKKKKSTFVVLFFYFTLWCYGYIDPGTGSYVIQALIAVFVGASIGVKIFWKNIKGFFIRLFSKKGTASPPDKGIVRGKNDKDEEDACSKNKLLQGINKK